jgi:hypothetical protein
LLQSGLSLLAGRRYRATALLRAETTRDVRLRIVGSDAQTYAARVFTVGPTFGPISMDATTLADDPNATFEIDLGRSTVTTWIDDASLVLVAPSP